MPPLGSFHGIEISFDSVVASDQCWAGFASFVRFDVTTWNALVETNASIRRKRKFDIQGRTSSDLTDAAYDLTGETASNKKITMNR